MILRVQTILHTGDGIAANYYTNSWCITTVSGPDVTALDQYVTAFGDFFDDLAGIISLPVIQTGHGIKFYNLETPTPPNYPFYESTFDLTTAPSGAALPSEVAICLSFQGERMSGNPQARRRGRVYLGPITTSTLSYGRPTSTDRTTIAGAAGTLCANLKAASSPAVFSVWSGTDGAAVAIADGWVDDVYDTQRRRGLQTTAKTLWTAP
uniref:Uncharacterized protein n=1 Tax=uncultured prokaryote TaxID=198431 RepID=A0A0H5QNU6_9ZZZZ|nr:hypothetical protein [uncultured prokaryote]